MILERSFLLKWLDKIPSLLSHFYLLFVVLVSWVLFAHNSLGEAASYLKIMFSLTKSPVINSPTLYSLTNFYVLLIVGILFATPLMKRLKDKLPEWIMYVFYIGILILSTAYLVDATFNPFLYFRF